MPTIQWLDVKNRPYFKEIRGICLGVYSFQFSFHFIVSPKISDDFLCMSCAFAVSYCFFLLPFTGILVYFWASLNCCIVTAKAIPTSVSSGLIPLCLSSSHLCFYRSFLMSDNGLEQIFCNFERCLRVDCVIHLFSSLASYSHICRSIV